ncbi:MAG TPA: transporter, partial [Planctomycetota bacterium]|nr:transporter [Planctomycetota bacterium]
MRRLDLALVALYLVGVIGAGAALSRRQRSTRQYFLGGRRIPWWAISASIVATETSTITFISVPGIAYARGGDFRFLQLALGYVVGRVAIAVFLLPAYFRGELLTAYSLLATRFSSVVRALASILFIVMRTVGDGVRLLVTAGVLDEIRHWIDDDARGDWLPGAVVVLGVVTILFTLLGGMEAVLWIEVAQLAIYLAGAVAAAVVLATRVPGGIPSAFDLAESSGKLHLFDFTFDLTQRYTFWSGLVGGALLTMAVQGTEQFFVQRYLCTDDVRGAKRAVVASGVVVLAQFAL